MNLSANLLHGRLHSLRFGDRNDLIVGAVKYPDRHFADPGGSFGIAVGTILGRPLYELRVSLKCCSGRMNSSANYDQRGKTAGIFLSQIPGSVASHGKSGEIGS